MRTRDSVFEEIKPIVADVLAVEPEEVVAQARFFEDLGGESIDLLDLAFRFERHFGTPMPIQKMAGPEDILTDESGRLTEASLTELQAKYPYLDYSRFLTNPTKSRMTELVTVDALAGFVLAMLPLDGRQRPAESRDFPRRGASV